MMLPPAGPPRVLALAQLTNAIGDGAYLVCSALYFTLVIGLSPAQVGLGLTLAWAIGAVAGVWLGHVADRHGPRGTTAALALCTAGSVAAFLFVRSFGLFVVAACAYAICQSGLNASRQALFAGLVAPERRTELRAHLQSAANAGLAIGAAAGGIALQAGTANAYLTMFAADAAAFALAALLILRLPVVAGTVNRSQATMPGSKLSVLRDRPYTVVALLNAVMLLYMPMLGIAVPLWIAQRTHAPAWLVSVLLVLNTLSVVLFQVRIARRVRSSALATRFSRRAGWVMLAACLTFALAAARSSAWVATGVLLVAAGLQVLAEMMQGAAAWKVSFDLAPAGAHGQYQGLFGSGVAVARMAGPALLTTLILGGGIAGWLGLGLLFVAAGTAFGSAVRWAERTRRVAIRSLLRARLNAMSDSRQVLPVRRARLDA
ncbi:MFS transporter [Flindersiella endophytica]